MGAKVLFVGLAAAAACLTLAPIAAQPPQSRAARPQQQEEVYQRTMGKLPSDRTVVDDSLSPPHRQANFAGAKTDAAELATLAKELREELNKPNADLPSPEVISRAQKIERLAKKIREETKAY
jgi:hypothetical protein